MENSLQQPVESLSIFQSRAKRETPTSDQSKGTQTMPIERHWRHAERLTLGYANQGLRSQAMEGRGDLKDSQMELKISQSSTSPPIATIYCLTPLSSSQFSAPSS